MTCIDARRQKNKLSEHSVQCSKLSDIVYQVRIKIVPRTQLSRDGQSPIFVQHLRIVNQARVCTSRKGSTVTVDNIYSCAKLQEISCDTINIVTCRDDQRAFSIVINSIDIDATFGKQPHHIESSFITSNHKPGVAFVVPHFEPREPGINKELYSIGVAMPASQMERQIAFVVLYKRVGTIL